MSSDTLERPVKMDLIMSGIDLSEFEEDIKRLNLPLGGAGRALAATDTLFADISYYQVPVTNAYPYQFLSFRSNDGTYQDPHFASNLAWAKHSADTGILLGFIVYFVYETNWQQTLATFKAMVGTPHAKMAVMIDVESWGGKIGGNQSAALNALRAALVSWLGNKKRVIAYGNAGDLNNLFPQRGDIGIDLANYSGNPDFPYKLCHQFSDKYNTPPFGACDMNSADGMTPAQFAAALGLVATPPAPPKPRPAGPTLIKSPGMLKPGQSIVSPSGHYVTVFQADGNLVEYNWVTGHADWNSKTNGKGATALEVQGDGNAVIYKGSTALWSTRTAGKGAVFLQQQDDDNLVLYTQAGNKPVWSTK